MVEQSPPNDEEVITSVRDLLDRLQTSRAIGDTLWYRGQANFDWKIEPRITRNRGHLDNEAHMIRRFKQDAAARTEFSPRTEWEWVFLAQHYGLPTRLLDWTENSLIALYFAVESDNGDSDAAVDGALFELKPELLNERTTESPHSGILMFDHDEELDRYLPGKATQPGPAGGALAAIGQRSFDRIKAQAGCFTVTHRDHTAPALNRDNEMVNKLRVPAPRKAFIREELADADISASTVYPDLEHLAQHIREKYGR